MRTPNQADVRSLARRLRHLRENPTLNYRGREKTPSEAFDYALWVALDELIGHDDPDWGELYRGCP